MNAYDGALLVVSHDDAFLNAIGVSQWVDLASAASGVGLPTRLSGE